MVVRSFLINLPLMITSFSMKHMQFVKVLFLKFYINTYASSVKVFSHQNLARCGSYLYVCVFAHKYESTYVSILVHRWIHTLYVTRREKIELVCT